MAELAKYPNVALKWAHAPRLGGVDERFPFPTAMEYLLRAVDAFGRERILWASDYTRARVHNNLGGRAHLYSGLGATLGDG